MYDSVFQWFFLGLDRRVVMGTNLDPVFKDHIRPDKASTIALLIFTLFFRNAENFVSW